MAFVSRVEGGYGGGASVIHHDSSHHSVLVPDAELLFTGAYHRAGPDLVLTGHDGRHHLIPGYFDSEQHPALVAPNGAQLSGDVVTLLAGSPTPGQYAQAQQPALPPDAIGRVEKVVGDATVIRNGVAVALHVGDAVYKSDVVQTGAGSSLGILFPDGTALDLVANTRMALNEYSYDPNGTSNAALMTLVEGTFAFVAGKVAHTGSMKIDTPVATMGIRGTTGVVEQVATISATAGNVSYSFAVVADFGTGVTGQYDLVDANGNVIATIGQNGLITYVTPQGLNQPPLLSVQPISNSQYAFEQEILQQLFQTLNPLNLPNPNGNNGSSSPPPFEFPNVVPQLLGPSPTPINLVVPSNNGGGGTPVTITITGPSGPTTTVIWTSPISGSWDTAGDWSDGIVPTSYSVVEILVPITVTITGSESANGLVLVAGATLDITDGGSLLLFNSIKGAGTVELGPDPTLSIDGAVKLTGGGAIVMTSSADYIVGVADTKALLINVSDTISGTGNIGTGDGNLTFENFGTVDATGLLTINTGNEVYNDGLMEATAGGTLAIADDVSNAGTLESSGDGSLLSMADVMLDNLAGVLATDGGAVTFDSVSLTNETGAIIEATLGGTITFDTGTLTNDGTVESENAGSAITIEGSLEVNNNAGGMIEALNGGSIDFDGVNVINLSTIDADDGTITFNATAVTNYGGTIEAVDGGTVIIENNSDAAIFGGTIEAIGTGSAVQLESAGLNDLTLQTSDGGIIEAVSGISNLLNDTIAGGTMQLDGGAAVDLQGTTTLTGIVTFDGDGTALLDYTSYDVIAGEGGATLDNDATIAGAGTIGNGDGTLILDNEALGTIDADIGGQQFIIDTGGIDGNNGLMEATNGATLQIEDGVNNNGNIIADGGIVTITNDVNSGVGNNGLIEAVDGGSVSIDAPEGIPNLATGTIEADGAGSTVTITASVMSGAGSSVGNLGLIEALDGGSVTLTGHGGGVSNNGTMDADGGTITLTADDGGGITNFSGGLMKANGGTLAFNAAGGLNNNAGATIEACNGGILQFDIPTTFDNAGAVELNDGTIVVGNVTLDGGGSVTLSDDSANAIVSDGSYSVLINVDNTISGAGTIGDAYLSLTNETHGTIDADAADPLVLDTGSNAISNAGSLEATLGGALDIYSDVDNSGEISASGANSVVNLFGVTITGGTLGTSDGGIIETPTGTSTLDGVTIAGGSVLETDDGTFIDLEGTTTLDGTVTLEGGGTFVLDPGAAEIVGGAGGGTLDIAEGATLTGSGEIGNGGTTALSLSNRGTVDADVDSETLTIDTGAIVANYGLLEATNGATLAIDDSIDNESGGVIKAAGAGSTVTVTYNGASVNNSGTEEAVAGGTLDLTNNSGGVGNSSSGKIEANDGTVSITGGLDNDGTVEAVHRGTLTINIDNNNNNNGGVGNFGTIKADDGTISIGASVSDAVVLNSGSGTIEALNRGSITFNNVTVTNDGGTIKAAYGGSITFESTLNGVTNEDGGVIMAAAAGAVAIWDVSIENAGGVIEADGANAKIELFGATIDGGTLESSDGGIIANTYGTSTLNGVTLGGGSTLQTNVGTFIDLENTTVLAGAVTFEGGGTFVLDPGEAVIVGAAGANAMLDNQGTLTGSGEIGNGGTTSLTLTNNGTIDADVNSATLTIDTGAVVSNYGLLEATNGATLQIDDPVLNHGTIEAVGDCSTVTFNLSGATQTNSGTIEGLCGGAITYNGGTIDNSGGIFAAYSGLIAICGAQIDNQVDAALAAEYCGSVTIDQSCIVNCGESTIGAMLGGTMTIDHSKITNDSGEDLGNGGIVASRGGVVTICHSDVTNNGQIGADDGGSITFEYSHIVNNLHIGTGDALDTPVRPVGLVTFDHCTVTNNGVFADGVNGEFLIEDSTICNTNGSISTGGGNSSIVLIDATITGGTLQSNTGGIIEATSGTSTLDGVTLGGGSALQTCGGAVIDLEDTTTLDGTVTLEGGGTFVLDPGLASIVGGSDGGTLDIAVGATLTGSGEIGNGGTTALSLINNGTIDADLTCQTLTIDTGATVGNYNLLEATNCGILSFTDSVTNETGAFIEANGGTVYLNGGLANAGTVEAGACGTINITIDNTTDYIWNTGTIEAFRGGTINITANDDIGLENNGTLEADGGTINIMHDGTSIDSHAIFEATDGGEIISTSINSPSGGLNYGIEDADDGTIIFNGGNGLGSGALAEAINCGTIDINGGVTNEAGATMEALSGGTFDITVDVVGVDTTGVTNSGTMKADHATFDIKIDASGTNTAGGMGNTGTIESDRGGTFDITIDVSGSDDSIGLNNSNMMEADGGALNITFDVTGEGDGVGFRNSGTIEAIDCGTVTLNGDGINNASGTIEAIGLNSTINLEGVTINGGTLETSCGGIIETPSGTSTLNGVTLGGGTTLQTDDGTFIDLENTTVLDGTVTFEGGGTFVLDPGPASIVGSSCGGTLDIAEGAVLTGTGAIGNGGTTSLSLSNEGKIDADVCGETLAITTGSTVDNTGTLEATHGGTLQIFDDVDNDDGIIAAWGCGSTVQLEGPINIAGGTLKTGNRYSASGGVIEIIAVAFAETIFDGSAHAVTIDGYVQVDAGAALALDGTIDNKGTIDLASSCGPSSYLVIQTDVCLQGGGQVILTDGGDNAIVTNGSAVTLTNVDNTISGAGTIGDRQYLTLDNQSCGTIDANVCGATLTIDTGCNTITNCGMLEASGGGTLLISSTLDNSGQVVAFSDSHVQINADIQNDGSIGVLGGSLGISNSCIVNACDGSIFVSNDGGCITIDCSNIDNYGGLYTSSAGTITIEYSNLYNYGGLTDGGDGPFTGISANSGGSIIISCSYVDNACADSLIAAQQGPDSSVTFDHDTIVNNGTQVENDSDGILAYNGGTITFDNSCITNNGQIGAFTGDGEGAAAGTMLIENSTVNNACGTIFAFGSGDDVQLSDSTILGGTVGGSSGGVIEVTDCGTTLFDGSSDGALTIDGYVQVDVGGYLALAGTIDFTDGGNITLLADSDPGGVPDVVIDHTVTLDGASGGIVLNGCGDYIVGGTCDATLDNSSNISGAGMIGGGLSDGDSLTLVNDACGIVNADLCGQTLVIDTGSDVSNAGLMEATNGGTLQLADDICNSGLLSASCGGTLDVTASSITWTGDTATPGCNGIALDQGTLLIDSCSLTLGGGGAVSLDGGTIAAASCGNTLDNADAITGTGIIGCGDLVLNNESCGVIDANVNGGTLTLDTGCNTITNCGSLEASGGGILDINSAVDNCNGTLVAQSGGLLDVQSCISGGSATVAGGTLEFDAASNVNVTFCNGESGNDYGTLVLGDAAQFCGQISGFAGTAGGAANSDTVELTNFCETSYCVQNSGGNEILTLYGGGQQLTLTFDNFDGTFVVDSSGGNTYIYDPPATGLVSTDSAAGSAAAVLAAGSGMNFATDQINLASLNNVSGSSQFGSPSIAATTNDSFVFNAGAHATLNTPFEAIDLGHANAQSAQQTAALITAGGSQSAAFADPGHSDITAVVANAAMDQFHQMAASAATHH